MKLRIPGWVNRAWDLAERRRWVTFSLLGIVAGVGVAMWSWHPLALFTVGWMSFWTGMFLQQARVTEARDEVDHLLVDNARKDSMLRIYEGAQAGAPTRQMRSIGERGEPT